MHCPKCECTIKVKNGMTAGKQRYRCKQCGCNYTRSTPHGEPISKKKMAVQMYLEGMGFRSIGRVLEVSNVTILRWVRQAAQAVRDSRLWERSHTPPACIEIDEMWHYIQKNKTNFGCGLLMIETKQPQSGFTAVVVVPSRDRNSTKK